jgi:glycerate 2-kinase
MCRQDAIRIFEAGVQAVQPARLLPQHIRWHQGQLRIAGHPIDTASGRLMVLAVGKAAAAMAQQAEALLGDALYGGLCITKYGHRLPLQRLTLLEAAHPVPDEQSVRAAEAALQLVQQLKPTDTLLVLLSGGASALLVDVPPGCTLRDLQHTFDLLLKSGATIHPMNAVRKHLSALKGGQLAKAVFPAQLFTLVLSDVVGDELDTIASGPTVADRSSFADVYDILMQYGLWYQLPAAIQQHIRQGLNGQIAETPKPGDDCFAHSITQIIGSNPLALQAAQTMAQQLGYHTRIHRQHLTGETTQVVQELVQVALAYEGPHPACLLCGGETTVAVTGDGKGGRNQHAALYAQQLLQQAAAEHIVFLSAGTDGSDGPTDAAGAVVDKEILAADIDPLHYLQRFDAYHFFEQAGGLIKTGATQTNVMDLMVILITK